MAFYLAVGKVKHLPDPKDTINLSMMEVESRVTRRDERITARVTANSVVTTAVNTELIQHVSVVTLQMGLELLDVLILENKASSVEERSEALSDAGVEITLQAALVIGADGVSRAVEDGLAVDGEDNGAKVDRHVLEGTRGHAAAARAGREHEDVAVDGLHHLDSLVLEEGAVAAHRRGGAVEDGGRGGVVDV